MSLTSPLSPHRPIASAVIPARNEAERILSVLEVLGPVDALDQIIVVDDASEDSTREAVASAIRMDPRIHLIRLGEKRGKAYAMVVGAEAAAHDLIVFLDADLINLDPNDVRRLIEPVRTHEAEMTLGLFTGGRTGTDLSHWATPFLSGQRCVRWSLFRKIPDLAEQRAGVEVAMSLHARSNGLRVRKIAWRGVTHAMKMEKEGLLRGAAAYAVMYAEILKYVISTLLNPLRQRARLRLSERRSEAGGSDRYR